MRALIGQSRSGGTCAAADQQVTTNALNHVASTGDALLETEFGATTNTTSITRRLNLYDSRMIPWLFWSYTRDVVALNADGTLKPATGPNVNIAMLAALARSMLPARSEREAVAGVFAIIRNVSVPFGAPYNDFGISNPEHRRAASRPHKCVSEGQRTLSGTALQSD